MYKFTPLLASLLFSVPAYAAQWRVDSSASKLSFEGNQAGESFKGEFKKFTPVIDFDPKTPEKGKIEVTIEMGSVTIEGKDRQESISGEDWFNITKFPTAKFTSTSIERCTTCTRAASLGPVFTVKGNLSLKGVNKPLQFDFDLDQQKYDKGLGAALGGFTLNRNDFGIGQGRWASEEWVKSEVRVSFNVQATAR